MKTKILGLLAVVLLAGPMAANASLIIYLSDDGASGTNLRFDGAGTVISSDNFVYESIAVNFFAAGNDFSTVSPVATLGGGTINTFFAGQFGATGQSIEWFWPGVVAGASLSDADGLTFNMSDLAFSGFILGTYSLTRFGGFANVGDVTLIIGAVPEPGTLALLGLGLAGLGLSRRRKA